MAKPRPTGSPPARRRAGPVTRLALRDFTVFEAAEFGFSPGVNMLLGSHATGKTHVLKAIYALLKAAEAAVLDDPSGVSGGKGLSPPVWARLGRIFRPDGAQAGRLVRTGRTEAGLGIDWKGGALEVRLDEDGCQARRWNPRCQVPRSLFLPSREALTLYEDFVAAYLYRQLGFDETYYDLCVALSAKPVGGPRRAVARALLAPLAEALPPITVESRTGRFYVAFGGERMLESHLVSEGVRKLAGLVRLVENGSLAPGGTLFWDEPTGGLEPRLVEVMGAMLLQLAQKGIQVFVATQGSALPRALAVAMAFRRGPPVPVRFFGLHRPEPEGGVQVVAGETPGEVEPPPEPETRPSARSKGRKR